MSRAQSICRFLRFVSKVKFWEKPVDIDLVRPACCPCCSEPSRRGNRVVVQGHGVRRRQLRGVDGLDQEATVQELVLRRFRCCACGAVVTVGPDELVPRRLFSVTSIAMALFLWAASLWSPVRVRERLSPWKRMGATAAAGWATLRRWARQAVGGLLWPTVGSGPGQGTLREQAAGVVRRLDIHAGLTPSLPGVVAGAKRHGG